MLKINQFCLFIFYVATSSLQSFTDMDDIMEDLLPRNPVLLLKRELFNTSYEYWAICSQCCGTVDPSKLINVTVPSVSPIPVVATAQSSDGLNQIVLKTYNPHNLKNFAEGNRTDLCLNSDGHFIRCKPNATSSRTYLRIIEQCRKVIKQNWTASQFCQRKMTNRSRKFLGKQSLLTWKLKMISQGDYEKGETQIYTDSGDLSKRLRSGIARIKCAFWPSKRVSEPTENKNTRYVTYKMEDVCDVYIELNGTSVDLGLSYAGEIQYTLLKHEGSSCHQSEMHISILMEQKMRNLSMLFQSTLHDANTKDSVKRKQNLCNSEHGLLSCPFMAEHKLSYASLSTQHSLIGQSWLMRPKKQDNFKSIGTMEMFECFFRRAIVACSSWKGDNETTGSKFDFDGHCTLQISAKHVILPIAKDLYYPMLFISFASIYTFILAIIYFIIRVPSHIQQAEIPKVILDSYSKELLMY